MRPKRIKELQAESRGLAVRRVDKTTFKVTSASDENTEYTVTVRFGDENEVYARCNCIWGQHQGVACSHVMAALDELAAQKERRLSFWLTADEARRQKHRMFYLARRDNDHGGVWITSRA